MTVDEEQRDHLPSPFQKAVAVRATQEDPVWLDPGASLLSSTTVPLSFLQPTPGDPMAVTNRFVLRQLNERRPPATLEEEDVLPTPLPEERPRDAVVAPVIVPSSAQSAPAPSKEANVPLSHVASSQSQEEDPRLAIKEDVLAGPVAVVNVIQPARDPPSEDAADKPDTACAPPEEAEEEEMERYVSMNLVEYDDLQGQSAAFPASLQLVSQHVLPERPSRMGPALLDDLVFEPTQQEEVGSKESADVPASSTLHEKLLAYRAARARRSTSLPPFKLFEDTNSPQKSVLLSPRKEAPGTEKKQRPMTVRPPYFVPKSRQPARSPLSSRAWPSEAPISSPIKRSMTRAETLFEGQPMVEDQIEEEDDEGSHPSREMPVEEDDVSSFSRSGHGSFETDPLIAGKRRAHTTPLKPSQPEEEEEEDNSENERVLSPPPVDGTPQADGAKSRKRPRVEQDEWATSPPSSNMAKRTRTLLSSKIFDDDEEEEEEDQLVALPVHDDWLQHRTRQSAHDEPQSDTVGHRNTVVSDRVPQSEPPINAKSRRKAKSTASSRFSSPARGKGQSSPMTPSLPAVVAPRRRVVEGVDPLPTDGTPEAIAEVCRQMASPFVLSQRVWAFWPEEKCFYSGTIDQVPLKTSRKLFTQQYRVLFDDQTHTFLLADELFPFFLLSGCPMTPTSTHGPCVCASDIFSATRTDPIPLLSDTAEQMPLHRLKLSLSDMASLKILLAQRKNASFAHALAILKMRRALPDATFASTLFQKFCFIVAATIEVNPSDPSASGTPAEESRRGQFIRWVERAGGLVVRDIEEARRQGQRCKRPHSVMICASFNGRDKFLGALAAQIPCVLPFWVIQCITESKRVPMQTFLVPNGMSSLCDRLVCHHRAEHPVFGGKRVLYLGHQRDEATWQLILSLAGAEVILPSALDALLQSASTSSKRAVTPSSTSKGRSSSTHAKNADTSKSKCKLDYILYTLDADFTSMVRRLQNTTLWIPNKTSIVTKEFFKECLIQQYIVAEDTFRIDASCFRL